MTHVRDHFLTWMRSAHAMEEQAIAAMSMQIGRIRSYPDIKHQLEHNLQQAGLHVKMLTTLQGRYQETGSGAMGLRDMAARMTGRAQGVGALFTSDEIVQTVMYGYGFIHLQIAQYRVLIAAADELDDEDAADIFRQIIEDKQPTARWLEANLDFITRIFLMRDERELMAKR